MRAALAGLLLLVAFPASASAGTQGCGHIARIGEQGTEIVKVSASGVACRRARRVLVRHAQGRTTRGWTCNSAGSEAVCTRGSASASYRAARSRDCGSVGFEPNTDNGAFGIRARGVGCRGARRVARGSRDFGPTNAQDYIARHFRCRARRGRAQQLETALYTCRLGRRIVAFERS